MKELQTALGLKADGDCGLTTKTAVVAAQTAAHLHPDGVVGQQTWAAIFK